MRRGSALPERCGARIPPSLFSLACSDSKRQRPIGITLFAFREDVCHRHDGYPGLRICCDVFWGDPSTACGTTPRCNRHCGGVPGFDSPMCALAASACGTYHQLNPAFHANGERFSDVGMAIASMRPADDGWRDCAASRGTRHDQECRMLAIRRLIGADCLVANARNTVICRRRSGDAPRKWETTYVCDNET